MDLVVTGGTGFIGKHLCQTLRKQGHNVVTVGPHPFKQERQGVVHLQADLIQGEIPTIFSECDAIIHLAGATIFHRWTSSYKQLIIESRIGTAHAIYRFLSQQTRRPHAFISASAVGFYGDRGEELLDETSLHGTGFLASTCVEWEQVTAMFGSLGMRTVSVRTAPVLSLEQGMLSSLLPLFRWGLGGNLGKGTQWFPWIHIKDLVNIYVQAITDTRFSGPINAVAPESVRNAQFTKTLGLLLKKPTVLSVPAFVLQLGLGELATALLSSQRVLPRSLQHLNFPFLHPTLQQALTDCLV